MRGAGHGLTGGVGRCYNFFVDFSECMAKAGDPVECVCSRSRSRSSPQPVHPEPGMRRCAGVLRLSQVRLRRCKLPREDYFECLHHGKEVTPTAPRELSALIFPNCTLSQRAPLSACRSQKCGLSPARLPVQIARNNAIRQQADRIATGQTDDHGHGHGGH